MVHIKTKDAYEDSANDVEKRFDTSNYELEGPLPKRKNKKVIGLMKDELARKIMRKFAGHRPKTYFYLIDDGSGDKIAKGIKMCVIKRRLKFEDYKKKSAHKITKSY